MDSSDYDVAYKKAEDYNKGFAANSLSYDNVYQTNEAKRLYYLAFNKAVECFGEEANQVKLCRERICFFIELDLKWAVRGFGIESEKSQAYQKEIDSLMDRAKTAYDLAFNKAVESFGRESEEAKLWLKELYYWYLRSKESKKAQAIFKELNSFKIA